MTFSLTKPRVSFSSYARLIASMTCPTPLDADQSASTIPMICSDDRITARRRNDLFELRCHQLAYLSGCR